MIRAALWLIPLLAMIGAPSCTSESASPDPDGAADVGVDGTTGADGSAGGTLEGLAINEFRALTSPDGTSQDWVELHNAGAEALDLTGYAVTDEVTNGCQGEPQTEHITAFPDGLQIPAGGYLLILGNRAAAGLQTECLADGPAASECMHVTWGIRKNKGESVFILDAAGAIILEACYPPDVLPDAADQTMTWGRVPDGTGEFVATLPTPGAANTAAP